MLHNQLLKKKEKKKEETKQTHKHQQDTWKSVKSEEQSFRTLKPDGNILNSAFSDSEIRKRSQGTDLSSSCFTKWNQKKKYFKWKKSKTYSQEE